jgi:thymidylate kinase
VSDYQAPARSPEGFFLEALFSKLNLSSVRYAVMRNYESLPYSARGSDLDLLITADYEDKVYSLIVEAIRECAGVVVGITKTVGFFKIFCFGRSSELGRPWWGLRIDVNIGLYYLGQEQLDCSISLPMKLHNDIDVLEDGFAGVLGVLKDVLNNLTFPVCYGSAARGVVTSQWATVEDRLSPLGKNTLALLKKMVLAEHGGQREAECRQLRTSFVIHSIIARPLCALGGVFVYEWSKVKRYLKPEGILVAVLGVDGAGKSTLIGAIKPILDAATHNAAVIYHLRPGLLPPLARLKGAGALPVGPVIDPHGSKPSGVFGSLFRLAYLTLDYVAGYWLKTRVQIARQPSVIIFDRYAYDMLLDPLRFRIGISARITGWFAAMAPTPDMIFCLLGEPEVIAARKGELPVEETRRQVATIQAFAKRNPRAVMISTESSIEDARDQVLQAMSDFLQTRMANRR